MLIRLLFLIVVALSVSANAFGNDMKLNDFEVIGIDGDKVALSEFKGSVVLVTNVASRCGFTPQYEGLQALYKKYQKVGFIVLGFPSNEFGEQEPGSNAEIKKFCSLTYSVTFPLFAKSSITGPHKNPFYRWLIASTDGKEIGWNFEKFLIGRDGMVVGRFSSSVHPDDPKLVAAIETALRS